MDKLNLNHILDPDWLKSRGIVDYAVTQESKALTFHHFEKWVDEKKQGALGYLADHRKEMREDIKSVFPEFQSAIVFLFSYEKQAKSLEKFYQSDLSNGSKIASYVLGFEGEDYHVTLLNILNEIKEKIQNESSLIQIKHSLDIQPVLERDLAYRAGLGWFGKNSMLINRKYGSYFLIGSLLLSEKVDAINLPIETDHCGNCQACVDACPTRAIDPKNRTLIADQCISTFSIELFKDAQAPEGMTANARGEIFGCDICQIVCPWNRKDEGSVMFLSQEMNEKQKLIYDFFLTRNLDEVAQDLESMTNRAFRKLFKETSLERTGRIGLLKNINAYRIFRKHNSK